MRIDVMTLFPDLCDAYLKESILGRAASAGIIETHCHNIRDYTKDKHNRVDDAPYGGGMGMLMAAQPIDDCFSAICAQRQARPHVIYMSPKGAVLTQNRALELSATDGFCVLCGHYEGVDERIIESIVDEEISIGDYVLTGGELPAMVLIDTVARLIPGVLSDNVCFTDESCFSGLLEYPQYTRPPEWKGMEVPEVLLSGHHKNIGEWRQTQSFEITKERRPDLWEKYCDGQNPKNLEQDE